MNNEIEINIKSAVSLKKRFYKLKQQLEKKADSILEKRESHEEATVITYDGYEIHSYEDIQDLYGNGIISSRRMDLLNQQLMDAMFYDISEADLLFKEIWYIEFFIKELDNTIEMEQKKGVK